MSTRFTIAAAGGLDAPTLLAEDGSIEGVVELEGCDLAVQRVHIHTIVLGEAGLCGGQLVGGSGQLSLELGGGGLFAVDVRTVFLHDPVQLFVGDAGDLGLYVFTFH